MLQGEHYEFQRDPVVVFLDLKGHMTMYAGVKYRISWGTEEQ